MSCRGTLRFVLELKICGPVWWNHVSLRVSFLSFTLRAYGLSQLVHHPLYVLLYHQRSWLRKCGRTLRGRCGVRCSMCVAWRWPHISEADCDSQLTAFSVLCLSLTWTKYMWCQRWPWVTVTLSNTCYWNGYSGVSSAWWTVCVTKCSVLIGFLMFQSVWSSLWSASSRQFIVAEVYTYSTRTTVYVHIIRFYCIYVFYVSAQQMCIHSCPSFTVCSTSQFYVWQVRMCECRDRVIRSHFVSVTLL